LSARWAVVNFPGSNCDQDFVHAVRDVVGSPVVEVWHKDAVPDDIDCIAIPGGFSYGDYLRTGALAAMSPVMKSVKKHAERGTLVIGVCNGFQILVEAGLLPGALVKNAGMRFRCLDWHLRVERDDVPFTAGFLRKGDVVRLPIAHGYGNYWIPADQVDAVRGQILFAYCDAKGAATAATNPNGSMLNVAGIVNERGNVLGMMPHPERAVETLLGGTDGLGILKAMDAAGSGVGR